VGGGVHVPIYSSGVDSPIPNSLFTVTIILLSAI